MIWRPTYRPLLLECLKLPRAELWLIATDVPAFDEVHLWLKMLDPHRPSIGSLQAADFHTFLAPSIAKEIEVLETVDWIAAMGHHPNRAILAFDDFAHVGLPTEESLEYVLNRITLRGE